MERRNRNIWIAVIVIAVIGCCCVAAIAAGAVAWFVDRVESADVDPEIFVLFPNDSERVEEIFQAGESPFLEIKNFAGNVTVRAGEDNAIHVVAIKRASGSNALDRITVSMSQQGDRVVVRTTKVGNLTSARVDLEITAPAGTEMDLNTGAGDVELRDLTGTIRANSGAGNLTLRDLTGSVRANSGAGDIDARGAAGPMQLGVGAGSVRYEGTPSGYCSFETGAGDINLRLPANPDVRVDLHTGLGTINVSYDVDGQTSARNVDGVIGNGERGSIYAHTGLGSISVRP